MVTAIKSGGNVLVPCAPFGIVLDFLDVLMPKFSAQGLGGTKVLVVSPRAKQSLEYASILPEWMHESRRRNAYQSEPCFNFQRFIDNNALILTDDLAFLHEPSSSASFRSAPFVVIASHPCLRLGPALDCLRR